MVGPLSDRARSGCGFFIWPVGEISSFEAEKEIEVDHARSFKELREVDSDISGVLEAGWSGSSVEQERVSYGYCRCDCSSSCSRWGLCRFVHILQEVEVLAGTQASNAEL